MDEPELDQETEGTEVPAQEELSQKEELREGHKVIDGVEYVTAEQNQSEVNRIFKRYKTEESARKQVESEFQDTKSKLLELEQERAKNIIPPMPDQYSEDFDERIKEREEAIRLAAQQDRDIEHEKQAQSQLTEQSESERIASQTEMVKIFDNNMYNLGLNPIEMVDAGKRIADHGITQELEDTLLKHPAGPLMVKYLDENPMVLDEYSRMTTGDLVTNIPELSQKASLLKPQTSKAPDPPDTLSGGGVPELEDPALKGVTWE